PRPRSPAGLPGTLGAVAEVTSRVQPSSLPFAQPGKIDAPVRGCLGPSYSFLSAATCGSVRQALFSAPLQSIVSGLNEHLAGSSIRLSTTPSAASQAATAAAWIAGSFDAGMAAPGALSVCASQTNPAFECD